MISQMSQRICDRYQVAGCLSSGNPQAQLRVMIFKKLLAKFVSGTIGTNRVAEDHKDGPRGHGRGHG